MQEVRLSRRLAAIFSLLPDIGGAADVGTDHGHIPVRLLQSGFSGRVCATDIRKGPLSTARRAAEEAGFSGRIEFYLTDGLDGIDGNGIASVVIAGMGGENIAAILARAPWTKENRLLVLQPMSKAPFLRRWLLENGYRIETESLVPDGPVYELLTARGGQDTPLSSAELLTGRFTLISGDPLFSARLDELIHRQTRAVAGLSVSTKQEDAARLLEEQETLALLLAMRERMMQNGQG